MFPPEIKMLVKYHQYTFPFDPVYPFCHIFPGQYWYIFLQRYFLYDGYLFHAAYSVRSLSFFTQYFKYWFIRYSGTYSYTWNMLIRKRLLDTSATHYVVSRPIFMILRSLFILVNHLQHIWIFPLCQKFVLFHWVQPNLYENIRIAVHLYSFPDMATQFCIFIADQVQHLSIFTTFLKYISFIAKIPYISINNPWLAYRQDSGCC